MLTSASWPPTILFVFFTPHLQQETSPQTLDSCGSPKQDVWRGKTEMGLETFFACLEVSLEEVAKAGGFGKFVSSSKNVQFLALALVPPPQD